MKRLIIVIVFLITGLSFNTKANAPRHDVQFGFFYSSLSPYGSWIEINQGVTVWRPTIIKRGWIPYRDGRWIWTADGWYWDSYEPFGYITFHYGRWYYDDYYGWIWVPDYEWAPAWVEWRYDDYYVGWAPLSPYAEFSISLGIHYTYDYHVPYNYWHFVKYNHFCDPYVDNYYVTPKYKYRVFSRTKYRTNYGYHDGRVINRGVDIDYVRKRTGQDIREREIVRVSDPNEFERYRNNNNGRGNNDVVRTLVASREQISKEDGRNFKIEKPERKSSLEISKVRIGNQRIESGNREKSFNEKTEVRKEDRNNESRIKNEETIIRKGEGTTGIMKKDIEKKNVPERSKNFGSGNRENSNSGNNAPKNQDSKREIKKETNRTFSSPKNNVESKHEVKREVKRETVKENRAPQKRNEVRNDNKRNESRNSNDKRKR